MTLSRPLLTLTWVVLAALVLWLLTRSPSAALPALLAWCGGWLSCQLVASQPTGEDC